MLPVSTKGYMHFAEIGQLGYIKYWRVEKKELKIQILPASKETSWPKLKYTQLKFFSFCYMQQFILLKSSHPITQVWRYPYLTEEVVLSQA